jgi:hypothetical protein
VLWNLGCSAIDIFIASVLVLVLLVLLLLLLLESSTLPFRDEVLYQM